MAYYKQWGNSRSKISVASFHRDFYGKPCPSVKKSHTILTMLLRHAPEKYAALYANDLIHELLSLKDAQGAAFVDIDRLFQHEENQQPTTYTQHSLISYLMELISLTKTPDNRKYHIGILRALLLNENPSFGNFLHNPSATSYEHAILSNSYSLNTFTFAVGFSLPEVACFYCYIFPEAVCFIKHMYPHKKNESHPKLRSLATQLTTQFIEEILSCKGHIIVAPSFALINIRTHTLAQDMFNTWLRQTATNIQQLKELLFEFKLNKDRTNLLFYFLLSYNIQDSEHKTILAHWQRFTTPRTTQPPLNWPTLQKFIIEYAKLNPRHWELKAQ